MKIKSLKTLLVLFGLFFCLNAQAQDKIPITEKDYGENGVEMADAFRADGKIYVVISVVSVILFGMFFYLVRTENRLKKVEELADEVASKRKKVTHQ